MTVKHFLFCTILTDKQLTVKIYKRPASVKRLKKTLRYKYRSYCPSTGVMSPSPQRNMKVIHFTVAAFCYGNLEPV